jgi:hypothetical protein
MGRGEVHTGFLWGNMRGDHLEDPGVDGDNIKMDLREMRWRRSWTGSIWLRIGIGGGLL